MKILVVEGDSGTMVYCNQCGAIAGVPTECVGWKKHNFTSTTVPVICENCGAIPGKPTKCPGWQRHNFKPIPEPRY